MQKNAHFYKKDEITVIWKSGLCAHSGICFRGLPTVFDPRRKPWIITENADQNEIVAQVLHCPSEALSIKKEVT
jgi:uncharacterized Fe-S cluster protein YjdI